MRFNNGLIPLAQPGTAWYCRAELCANLLEIWRSLRRVCNWNVPSSNIEIYYIFLFNKEKKNNSKEIREV